MIEGGGVRLAADETLEQKAGATPLIDSGKLLASITHELRRVSEGG